MKSLLRGLSVMVVGLALGVGTLGCGDTDTDALKPKMSVADALKGLKAEDSNARADAAIALGAHGEAAASAVPTLVEALKDPEVEVQRLAAYALGQIGPKASAAVPALKEMMKSDERSLYTAAVNALQLISPGSVSDKVVNVRGESPQ